MMVRSASTLDAFSALAEPKRRRMLEILALDERPVTDLVVHLGLRQPEVSKHLQVLRSSGLVDVRRQGKQRFYSVNGIAMKEVHDWVGGFERFWTQHLHSIKARAEAAARQKPQGINQSSRKEKP